MANTLNYGLPKPDIAKNIDEEFYVFRDTTLDMIDAAIKAVADAAAGKSAIGHGHAIADIAGLGAALESKMPASQTFSLDSLTDVEGASAAANGQVLWKTSTGWLPTSALAALGPHGHLIPEVTGLVDALAVKADASTVVRFDAAQSKTQAEQGQARANIGASVLAGFRNKIINGDFEIWQRFASVPSWVAPILNYYTADRWVAQSNGSGGNGSLTRQAFTPGQTDVPGNPEFFLRWQVSAAPSGQSVGSCYFEQRIEGVRTLAGRRATLTMYLKGTGTLPSINLVQVFGSGGSALVQTVLATNVVLQAGWTKVQYVFDIPSIAAKTVGTNNYLAVNLNVPVNSTYTLDIAHASLVEGDAAAEADPFSARHPVLERIICMRYFEPGRYQAVGYQAAGSGYGHSQQFLVPKRVSPSLVANIVSSTNTTSPSLSLSNINTLIQSGFAASLGVVFVTIDYTADAEIY